MSNKFIGNTSLEVSALGFGAGTLGNLYKEVSDADAQATLNAAWDAGLRYFDTAPFYGLGLSETRVGQALNKYGRDEYVISTKVGKLLHPAEAASERHGFINPMPNDITYDYSYDGVMRSHESSLKRLCIDRIDILLMHDIGELTHGAENDYHFSKAMEGGYKALDELRSGGVIKAIGLGVNEVEVCTQAMKHGHWDAFLLAGRYTLLEQGGLHDFLPACEKARTSIILGGAYNSGILATGTRGTAVPHYDYAPAPEHIIAQVRKVEDVCDAYAIPLVAAALQFPLAHPAVACVIPGMGNPNRIAQTLTHYNTSIPAGFWSDLKSEGLLDAAAPVPIGKLDV